MTRMTTEDHLDAARVHLIDAEEERLDVEKFSRAATLAQLHISLAQALTLDSIDDCLGRKWGDR